MTPARKATLEVAARIADERAEYHDTCAKEAARSDAYATAWEHQRARESCRDLAAAIRALKEQEPTT